MSSGVQHIRFRRPQKEDDPPKVPKVNQRHSGILQDQLRRAQRAPWCPSFSLAFRMIILIRVGGAMYSNISDCDEVYNFWEPLHYLDQGYGFQTWELSPTYSIRSWAYIVLHWFPASLIARFLSLDKRRFFFTLRILLGAVSAFCEAKLYRTVVEKINYRVGRYLFFTFLFNAGMWNASTAFLPSSFAMYANTFAFAYAIETPALTNDRRTLFATTLFAAGAIIGWPFSAAVAIPFAFEELFLRGLDIVPSSQTFEWFSIRLRRFVASSILASLFLLPVIGMDSLAYGKLTITPWNIIKYNILGGSDRGPDLYGSEPWYFYIQNLLINFNVLLPLALVSLPALAITYRVDRKRLGGYAVTPEQSSPYTLVAVRLAPFYLWLGILSLQPHKEERFMFPAYSMLAFNAAVSVYLLRGMIEAAFIKVTKSPYRASQSSIFRLFTLFIGLTTAALSISRILAWTYYYHAPLEVMHHFQFAELPRVLNVTGLLAPSPPDWDHKDPPPVDLTPVKELNLTFCVGKEWYRFPGHFLVPKGIDVEFIKSEFNGLLPRHFPASSGSATTTTSGEGSLLAGWWPRDGTRIVPDHLNDLNKEDAHQYVSVTTCDYLLDLDFPEHPAPASDLEPRYVIDSKHWDRVFCTKFLDSQHSALHSRILWLPGKWWQKSNSFGDYCLLKKAGLFEEK